MSEIRRPKFRPKDHSAVIPWIERAILGELAEASKRQADHYQGAVDACEVKNFSSRDDRGLAYHLREVETSQQEIDDLRQLLELAKSGEQEVEPPVVAFTMLADRMVEILSEEIPMNASNSEYDTAVKLSVYLHGWVEIREYAGEIELEHLRAEAVA